MDASGLPQKTLDNFSPRLMSNGICVLVTPHGYQRRQFAACTADKWVRKQDCSDSGHGGETHQTASASDARLTTNHGTPLSDNQNSLKAGSRGPALLEDFLLREKI